MSWSDPPGPGCGIKVWMTQCDLERSQNSSLRDPVDDYSSTTSSAQRKKALRCVYLQFIHPPSQLAWAHNEQHLCLWVICQRRWSGVICDAALVRRRQADVETGCNFKQRAFTGNGRTPATKATTVRLPLTALPFFSTTCVTPPPSWKTAALLQTVRRPHERASGIGPRQTSTDRPILMRWWEHLSVNPDEMFLSGKNSRSESFQTGRGTRPRSAAASWPRTAFGKCFPLMIQTPLGSKSKPDTMAFSSSPPQCGLHWSHYSPSVLRVTNRKPPQIFHECHTIFAIFLSLFDSWLMQQGYFHLFLWLSVSYERLLFALHWLVVVVFLGFQSTPGYSDVQYCGHTL